MADLFWDNLVEIEDIKIKIASHGFSEEEKQKLLDTVLQTIDMRMLDVVLTHLPRQKHQKFLDQFTAIPHHPKLLESLKEDIEDIEDKIKDMAGKIKSEILLQLDKL